MLFSFLFYLFLYLCKNIKIKMSRKILLLGLLIGFCLVACNDGDLEVETISFDNSDVLSCSSNDTAVSFLFKYSQKQALILKLPANVLENKEKTVSGTIPDSYKLYYRTFDQAPTTSYFCADFAPASPIVTTQIEATGGTVSITTKAIYDENTNALLRYDHLIRINDLVLINRQGNKVVDSNFIFGTYQTKR